jgi:membrane protease YdiL (CAAX protease family)
VFVLLVPYLLSVGLRPAPLDLARVAAYLAAPTLLLRVRASGARPLDVWQILAILAIWMPLEFDLFVLFADLVVPGVDLRAVVGSTHLLPSTHALLLPGVRLPIDTLTAVLLTLYLFLVRQPLKGIGLTSRLRWTDVRSALVGLLGFGVVGVPVGLAMGFLRYRPAVPSATEVSIRVIGGYLLVALPEEVLFRGIIQNLLHRRMQRGAVAMPIAAVVFGLAHLNNGTAAFPVPNWAYVLMATLAGLAYGWVWRRTGKVTASALTHMAVNLVWSVLFP